MDIFGFFFIPGDILPSVLQMEKNHYEWLNEWINEWEGKKEKRKGGCGREGRGKMKGRKEGNNIQIFRNESDDI